MDRHKVYPIETRYNGYRFRSRLEARWAVFFDAMGLRWEYEPASFTNKNGIGYLVDFEVENCFVEVKPRPLTQEEIDKVILAAHIRDVVVLVGPPNFRMYDVFGSWDRDENDEPEIQLYEKDAAMFDYNGNGIYRVSLGGMEMNREEEFDYARGYRAAVYAARSARFEFGENG